LETTALSSEAGTGSREKKRQQAELAAGGTSDRIKRKGRHKAGLSE
jgi:hypothetical protein